jgi:uncharacterized tellurite resistance protein B-like protein
MDAAPTLDGPLARAYAAALHAVAVADREIHTLESTRLDQLLERRCPGVDREELFFERITPESFAQAVRTHAADRRVELGQWFVADAVELATVDGEMRAVEAHYVLRCAKCLALTISEVGSVTRELDEWLGTLA